MDSPNERARSFLAWLRRSALSRPIRSGGCCLTAASPRSRARYRAGSAKAITTPQYCGTRYRPRARRVANCA